MPGAITIETALSNTATTDAIQVPSGMTLVGVSVPELTSTSFTITHNISATTGTYRTLKDPLGVYGAPGADITFTMPATSIGIYVIPPSVSALLNSWMKIVFNSSESASIRLTFKGLA